MNEFFHYFYYYFIFIIIVYQIKNKIALVIMEKRGKKRKPTPARAVQGSLLNTDGMEKQQAPKIDFPIILFSNR